MIPIKMIYEDSVTQHSEEVDVYHFHQTDDFEIYVTAWSTRAKYWLTIPLHMVSPIEKKEALYD